MPWMMMRRSKKFREVYHDKVKTKVYIIKILLPVSISTLMNQTVL